MPARIKPLSSGELRLVGNLERRVTGTDSTGAPTARYELVAANIFFALDDWRPTETFQAAQVGAQLSTRLVIRWRPGLEGMAPSSMRLVRLTNPGESPPVFEYYDIQGAVRDPTGRVQLTLTCQLRDAEGFRQGATP